MSAGNAARNNIKWRKSDPAGNVNIVMDESYKVLARKYRPQTFAEIIGQDAMVRVLRNAFNADRIAHAFILTGVRGVGKTTTARLIAKGLNCIGADGSGGPTTEPCGQCEHCVSIAEGRHVDVLEMDAASRTGVGDVREIIESVPYRAANARYKIYIVDEVHMLSNNAFNALLKTLEEPPEHVKFVFATTEIRMVPVTVLSRCQRFDLNRVQQDQMVSHLKMIAEKEGAKVADPALALVVRAAEGSVRDAISLLDQAISLGGGEIDVVRIREMLSLADRGRILDLLEMIMKGETAGALEELRSQYAEGVDPQALLRELAESVHWVSMLKISPEIADDPSVSPDERVRGLGMANALSMSILARAWQMLVKSLDELVYSPSQIMGAEMAVIRLTHAADLPTPQQLAKMLADYESSSRSDAGQPANRVVAQEPQPERRKIESEPAVQVQEPKPSPLVAGPAAADAARAESRSDDVPQTESAIVETPIKPDNVEEKAGAAEKCRTYEELLEFIKSRDAAFREDLRSALEVVEYTFGKITAKAKIDESAEQKASFEKKLSSLTSSPWEFVILKQAKEAAKQDAKDERSDVKEASPPVHPLVKSVMDAFPGILSQDSDSTHT